MVAGKRVPEIQLGRHSEAEMVLPERSHRGADEGVVRKGAAPQEPGPDERLRKPHKARSHGKEGVCRFRVVGVVAEFRVHCPQGIRPAVGVFATGVPGSLGIGVTASLLVSSMITSRDPLFEPWQVQVRAEGRSVFDAFSLFRPQFVGPLQFDIRLFLNAYRPCCRVRPCRGRSCCCARPCRVRPCCRVQSLVAEETVEPRSRIG